MKRNLIKNLLSTLTVFAGLMLCSATALADEYEFRQEEEGKLYWYENGVRQGTYDDVQGILGDGTNRGREIYDPATDAWYWLDSCYNGAKAVNKEVWIPYVYQDELVMSADGYGRVVDTEEFHYPPVSPASWDNDGTRLGSFIINQVYDRKGKWVRYDENGHMIKGWLEITGHYAEIYPEQAGNRYYYDLTTGAMIQGDTVLVDGEWCTFNEYGVQIPVDQDMVAYKTSIIDNNTKWGTYIHTDFFQAGEVWRDYDDPRVTMRKNEDGSVSAMEINDAVNEHEDGHYYEYENGRKIYIQGYTLLSKKKIETYTVRKPDMSIHQWPSSSEVVVDENGNNVEESYNKYLDCHYYPAGVKLTKTIDTGKCLDCGMMLYYEEVRIYDPLPEYTCLHEDLHVTYATENGEYKDGTPATVTTVCHTCEEYEVVESGVYREVYDEAGDYVGNRITSCEDGHILYENIWECERCNCTHPNAEVSSSEYVYRDGKGYRVDTYYCSDCGRFRPVVETEVATETSRHLDADGHDVGYDVYTVTDHVLIHEEHGTCAICSCEHQHSNVTDVKYQKYGDLNSDDGWWAKIISSSCADCGGDFQTVISILPQLVLLFDEENHYIGYLVYAEEDWVFLERIDSDCSCVTPISREYVRVEDDEGYLIAKDWYTYKDHVFIEREYL